MMHHMFGSVFCTIHRYARVLIGLECFQALVRDAMDTIDDKLDSPLGRLACLGTCFRYARGEELPLCQDALVERAVPMAVGPNR
jgi:hypothetical protein